MIVLFGLIKGRVRVVILRLWERSLFFFIGCEKRNICSLVYVGSYFTIIGVVKFEVFVIKDKEKEERKNKIK